MFSLNKKIKSFFITAVIVFFGCNADAQNINSPNKMGPLGTTVNTFSGNLFVPRNDLYIPARGFAFNMTFFYNSYNFDQSFGFGNGWSFSYSIKYSIDTAGNNIIVWGDGREDNYSVLPGGLFKSPTGFFDTLSPYQPGKYLLSELDGTKYYFDNSTTKKITRMQEPNGNYINFNYTDSLLTSIVNNAGQAVSFNYNGAGQLSTMVDAITSPTRTWTYTYDGAGNLKQVTDPLGGTDKYTYLVNGPMKTVSDKNSNIVDIIYYGDYSVSELIGCNKRVSFSYDTTAKITVATDYVPTGSNQVTTYGYKEFNGLTWITSLTSNCCGYNMKFEFDNNGNKTKQTDANGNITTYTYDSRGNALTVTDALGQTMTYTYSNAFNNITSCTDAKGNLTTMAYNSAGNLIQLTSPGNLIYTAAYAANGDIISSVDPKGNTFTYNYDAYGNPVSVTGPNGYQAGLGFDARGHLLSYTDARGNTRSIEYDILDRLKKIIDPANNNVQLTYDAEGNLTTIKNQNNETSRLNYDASNRLVQFTDAINDKTYFTYDAMDNTIAEKDALGNTMNYTYDTRNRLSGATDALGNSGNYSYDANGNVVGVNLPNGRQVTYTYDQLDRMTSVHDNSGAIASMAYDKNNNVTSYTNGTGATTTITYDSLDRAKQITDALGNSSLLNYDNNSNITSITDRNGFVKSYTYDGLNRVKTYTDNNAFVTTLNYDAAGNVTSVKDQNNNTTTYSYDNMNRVSVTTYPDGKFMQNTYDSKSNVITKRLTDGTTIGFVYDSLNRIISKNLPGGNTFTYAYDAIGRVISATNNAGTVAITYDALSRITSETFDGRTTRYNYDIAGRTQTTIYPDSTTITKTFDTRNRLTGIAKGNTSLLSYQYNNANQVIGKNFANGVSSNMQYDFANRLSNISTASGTIQNSNFAYDKEMNKTAVNRQNNTALSEQFSYDHGYRVTNYQRGAATNTYSYDAAGDRTSANTGATNTVYIANNLNQLTNSNNGAQNINFTYDNNGNLTYDGQFYKKYDAEGRLMRDSISPTNVLSYQYDAFGRRIQKTLNGVPYKYTYSGMAQIEERDGISNNLLNRTIFNNFLSPVVNEKSGNTYYYHQNEVNSVEAITNASGNITETYRYDVYGKQTIYNASGVLIPGSVTGNRFGFTGQEYDSATGGNQFHFRNYSPSLGVFDQRDRIGYADGMGMYQYVHDNPANGIDIFGLDDCDGKYISDNEKEFAEKISKLTNYLSMISESLKVPGLDLAAKSKTYNRFSISANVLSTITKLDMLEKNYNKMSTKDAQVEIAEIELAVAGIANDLGYFKAIPGFSKAVGILGAIDALTQEVTTKSLSHHYAHMSDGAEKLGSAAATKAEERFQMLQKYIDAAFKTQGSDIDKWTDEAKEQYDIFKRVLKFRQENVVERPKPNCPHNTDNGGTRKKNKYRYDPKGDSVEVVQSNDPNEIIGPDGVQPKHWVSVKDRLPYTILYENSKAASAPAKFVRITSPVEPKEDASTFQLGNFGFNNQTFSVPPSTASYYQRLDARDSLGLFVDVTAGYDQIGNQAFWEFQSIDPVTLLPPADPLKGFLLLQDSSKPLNGHAFVNFSMKPRQTAITLDTIAAKADIVFDTNDTIPTNIAKNTIDAFPPTSHMSIVTSPAVNTVALSWTGTDDAGGCGIDHYSIYFSNDHVNFHVLIPRISSNDTTITLPPDTSYCFFVLATDRVGNTETLRQGETQCFSLGQPVPISWLYFRGKTVAKDNILDWATANEQNSKQFDVERSLNGISFSRIGIVNAAGNSSQTSTYQYKDPNIDRLNSNLMFYRLKQIDINGNFKYSNIVKLSYNAKQAVNSIVYPNPTQGMITILLGDNSLIGTMANIYDVNGRMVESIRITAGSQSINLAKYMNGTYLIKLSNSEVLKIEKL